MMCSPLSRPAAVSVLWSQYSATRSPAVRAELAAHYRVNVVMTARKFCRRLPAMIDFDDLVSAGSIALLRAIERYDGRRGVNFIDFVLPAIRGAMIDYLRALDWAPRRVRREGGPVARMEPLPAPRSGRRPGAQFAARNCGGRDDVDRRDWFAAVCRRLDHRERLIVELYYVVDLPMSEISRALGISESYVSFLHTAVIRRLRAQPPEALVARLAVRRPPD